MDIENRSTDIARTLDMAHESGNPLFLWGALFRLLESKAEPKANGELTIHSDVSIPPAIAQYLLRVAFNIQLYGWGEQPPEILTKDWEATRVSLSDQKVTTEEARREILKALELSTGRGGGPFKEMRSFQKATEAASIYRIMQKSGETEQAARRRVETKFNVGSEQARKLIALGERLLSGEFPKKKLPQK